MGNGGITIAASANVENIDSNVRASWPIVTERLDESLNYVMSNSFGFGGTNVSLVFSHAQ